MSETELVTKILEYIKTWYKADYVGYISVEKLNPGYKFKIGIPSYMMPTTLATDINDEDVFLDLIYTELRTKNYIRNFYYQINRTDASRDE